MVLEDFIKKNTSPDRTVVRLKTNVYYTDKKLVFSKELTFLKRKSIGPNWVLDEAGMVGVEGICIENLYSMPDGIYQIITCNHDRDYETGYLESWDYKLIPIHLS